MNYAKLFTRRSDGRYCTTVTISGKRKYLYSRDPKELYQRVETLKEQESTLPTFADLAEVWEADIFDNHSPGTQACYAKPLQRAQDEFGDTLATDISMPDIFNLLQRMAAQGYSAKTIKMQRTVLHQIYQYAMLDRRFSRVIKFNPAAAVPLPKGLPRPAHREAPESDVVAKIRASTDLPFGLFALLLISTGFRRGEALGLRWSDIGETSISCFRSVSYRGTVVIGSPKTAAGVRKVPLLPDLRAALEKIRRGKPNEYVFHGEDPTKPLAESTFRRRWASYLKSTGLDLTPHVLRHGYATLLFEAGVDVYTAQKLLGHADVSVTQGVYTHLRDKQKEKSLASLAEYVQTAMDA